MLCQVKQVGLGLRILDTFTKHVGFKSTHIAEYSYSTQHEPNSRTQPANTNCHPFYLMNSRRIKSLSCSFEVNDVLPWESSSFLGVSFKVLLVFDVNGNLIRLGFTKREICFHSTWRSLEILGFPIHLIR